MEKHRFIILLVALSALLIVAPLVREFSPIATPTISRIVIAGLFVSILLSAVFAVGRTRLTTRIAVSLAAPVVLFEVLQIVYREAVVDVPAHLLGIAFLGFVVFVIFRYLFAENLVTSNTICAAVCVYLLLGILWALVLSTVEIVQPGSFKGSLTGSVQNIRFGGAESIDALYLSFVTLTTLGFGDITPSSPTAKMLVTMEAVVGQLFLTVLVARLVGLHIIHANRHGDDSHELP